MRIGILELLAPGRIKNWKQAAESYVITKQHVSIMPQAISGWCRQMGHEVFYATYYGQTDPKKLVPSDLDIIFIATFTRASALAYALAKLFRADGALTVIGGPHAKSFPHDCLRFFDVAVTQCDRDLIVDIVTGGCDRGTIASSNRTLTEIPSVEERMPEIKASIFSRGKPYSATMVPLLSSVGCPYSCDFCTDWNNPYAILPLDHLEADLRFLSRELPGVKVAFHDPNFAVRFDETLGVLERIPKGSRVPYAMESSLSLLKGPRLQRLRDTNCLYVAPAVESWSSYSNKAGVGTITGMAKVDRIAEHLKLLNSYVGGIQVNFIFGLDCDEGEEPVELTKEFMSRTPFAWPAMNIPVPFGGTPLYDNLLREGRILRQMPFPFYYLPYLTFLLKNYDPVTYYKHLIDMLTHYTTWGAVRERVSATPGWSLKVFHFLRALRAREAVSNFRRILKMLKEDRQFRAFHEGTSDTLPEFYHQEYEALLGPYASLMSREERTPYLTDTSDQMAGAEADASHEVLPPVSLPR